MQPPGTGFCGALKDPAKQVAKVYSSAHGHAGHTDFVTQAAESKLRLKV